MDSKVQYQSTRVPEYHYSKSIDYLLESFDNTFVAKTFLSYLFILCISFLFSYSDSLRAEEQPACNASECNYTIQLDKAGFYIAVISLPRGGKEGVCSLILNSPTIHRGSFHGGGVLKEGNTIPSWVAFSLAQPDVVSIDPFNYPNDPVPFGLELLKEQGNDQYQTVWGPTLVSPGQRYTTTPLEPGFYIALASSITGARDLYGLSLWSSSLFGGVSGGFLDSQTGFEFVAFDVAQPQKVNLKLWFGNIYGESGASQPNLEIYYQYQDGTRELFWSNSVLAGSNTLTGTIVDENGQPIDGITITAKLGDDQNINSTAVSSDGGKFQFTNFPNRTMILEAVASGNRFATTAVRGDQGSVELKLLGFNEPTPVVNDDLFDLSGWVIGNAPVQIITEDSGTRQAQKDKILRLTTQDQGPQSISRTFPTEPGTKNVAFNFRFITSEVPGGYFGSQYNDYYNITIRSKSGGKVSDGRTMNDLGLSAFDDNGATAWRELSLEVNEEGDTVQIDLMVANVADGALDSSLEITTVGEQEISVIFTGSGVGRVISDPPGIDCTTDKPCESKQFTGTVKLTAMTIDGKGLEIGNHFTAWRPIDDWSKSCAKSDSPNVCTLPATEFKDYGSDKKEVTVQFTLERCFGGVGNGCEGVGLPGSRTEAENGKISLWVSVGSIWHDTCCLRHPLGYACQGYGTKTADAENHCKDEWDKAFPNLGGRGWTHVFGPYDDDGKEDDGKEVDDLTEIISSNVSYEEVAATLKLKAPDGTELDVTDAAYCKSGNFSSKSPLEEWFQEQLLNRHFGVCRVAPEPEESSSPEPTSQNETTSAEPTPSG